MEKRDKLQGGTEIFLTFLATCVSYYMYMDKYLKNNVNIMNSINELLSKASISTEKISYFLIGILTMCLLIFLVIGFVIYRIIFKEVCKCDVEDSKLFLSVMTAYALSFLIGYFLIGLIPLVIITVLCNLIEMVAVILFCYENIKGKVVLASLIRGVLIILNVFFQLTA
jgi:hypothetical protein